MPEIMYRDREYLIVRKPVLMPVEPDASGDADLLSTLKKTEGEVYLVHRLDRAVGGLLLFARTKAGAAKFSAMVAGREVGKTYLAVAEGITPPVGEFTDYLAKDARAGRAVVSTRAVPGAKEAKLRFETLASVAHGRGNLSLVRVTLLTGRFHQIRAQFASHGHPLAGDGKYGSHDKGCTVALYSSELTFTDRSGEHRFVSKPDTAAYPWNLFLSELL